MFKINLEYVKGILFVRLKGNLNKKTSQKIYNYLVPVIMKYGIKYIVYNLYELETIDDMGIKSFNYTKSAVQSNQGIIYICELPESLKNEFVATDIDIIKNELSAMELIKL